MSKRTTAAKTSKRSLDRRHLTAARAAKSSASTERFIVEMRGSDVYINGYKVLVSEGTVSRSKFREAARKVAAERK